MRLRHKKHLNERIAKVENLIDVDTSELNSLVSAQNPQFLNFEQIFGNNNPVTLELGCGFGAFARKFGALYPNKNLVAVEKLTNVLVVACEQTPLSLSNVRFLNTGAEYLLTYFKNHSVDSIHLNFSTPYQKKHCANRRMTHPKFLKIYQQILKPDAKLYYKTDDDDFFEFSKEQFENENWNVVFQTRDLHNSEFANENIITEYESKFIAKGVKIKMIIATPPRN